jgi:hypothetical protein
MSKNLTKDERAALIAEFDLGIEPSQINPDYYVIKNKNGVYNCRQIKLRKKPVEETVIEYSDTVKAAMTTIENELGTGSIRVKKPQAARDPVVLSEEAKAAVALIEQQTGVKVRVPKSKPRADPTEVTVPITPAPQPVKPGMSFKELREKPKAL